MAAIADYRGRVVQDPPVARTLFSDTRFAILWLVVRLFVGWQWIDAGWHKFNDPAWMQTGSGLKGYWTAIAAVPKAPAKPAITYDWYRGFIQMLLDGQHYVWFGKLITFGELFVGIALIIGAFVGVAALFGAVMNFSYLLAGTASTNPVLLILAILLIVAWKTAGYFGADHFLLRRLGTPWRPKEEEVARHAANARA